MHEYSGQSMSIHLTHKHFLFLTTSMKGIGDDNHYDLSTSQSNEENYNNNHSKKDIEESREIFLEKVAIYKMIQEN